MYKIVRKYYDLPKVEDHFIEKKICELNDGDLILEFYEYKTRAHSDYLPKKSGQKNLYKVLTFREDKKSVLADGHSVAIIFDQPVGLLSFDFFYNIVKKINTFFGLIKRESYFTWNRDTRHISYFLPNAYPFKEGMKIIKIYDWHDKVNCLINAEIILDRLNNSTDKSNDENQFWTMNYSDYFVSKKKNS